MKKYYLKEDVEFERLKEYGFGYNKYFKRWVLLKSNNENWAKMILEVGTDRLVKPCGTSINYEEEIKLIKNLVEERDE